MSTPRTLLDKLWASHEIMRREDGLSLLWIDRHFVHEGSHHAFAKLTSRGLPVARPELTFAVTDHYVPTRLVQLDKGDAVARMIATLAGNARTHHIDLTSPEDPRRGIVHVVGPERGLTLPGLSVTCGDSHTSTHGAFGALAFGIGATDVAHVLATQSLWQRKPKALNIAVDGKLTEGVTAKDLALHWIATLGTNGASGHAIEYSGEAVRALTMSGRMTLCNLSIEGGARCGMIAPDQTTIDFVRGRDHSPTGSAWDQACTSWRGLASDPGAVFDRELRIEAAAVAPTVTWGTSPDQALPVDGQLPDPDELPPEQASATRDALAYMALSPGQRLAGLPIDQVFIGSCTNARIEDLRAAAKVLSGRRSKVPGLVSPGSERVKRQAEREGLDQIFTGAGLAWESSGCSLCVGMNGDTVAAGKRCASTTNRNFRGRQGPGARTHLMSPAMAAAAAVNGCIVDVRGLADGAAR